MEELYIYLIYFIVIFLLVFIIDYIFIKRPYVKVKKKKKKSKGKKKNIKDLFELSYISAKFKLDINKLPINRCLVIFSLLNAFIISFTVSILFMLDIAFIWQFLIGFVMLLGLIYALYELFGRFCVKKGWIKK